MHKKIVSFVKYNKIVLALYRFFGNAIILILKFFVRTDNKKILIMSFGGQKYDDSPKAIYEKIKEDSYFREYKLIWGFTDPKKYDFVKCEKIKVDTLKFYITAISSHIWITNSSIERGLHLKNKNCIEINTWHGTPLKKMGNDINNNQSYSSHSSKSQKSTIYCAQSEYDRSIFERFFNISKENILLSDLPRNDVLLKYSQNQINEIKKMLGISSLKKIILYAPTFREYSRDKFNACYLKPPIDIEKWKKTLGGGYIILFRAHYEVINVLGIRDDDFIKNVSTYPCLNDLIAISDMLISDYSSIYFDYSITEKPMLCFAYDYEEYSEKRGLYLSLHDIMPCNVNIDENSLLEEITRMDIDEYTNKTKIFKNRFAPNAGNATNIVIDKLKEIISEESINK